MPPRLIPTTLLTFCLVALSFLRPAQALQAVVMDRDLQTKVGYSTSAPGKLTLTVTASYSGPVVVLLAREDSEKMQYNTLQDRYDGFLKNGQLTLKDDDGQTVNLTKLLAGYKIVLGVQSVAQGQSTPPGSVKSAEPKSAEPKTAKP